MGQMRRTTTGGDTTVPHDSDQSKENLTIRQMQVFAMASRCVTFSEAAKRLGISQPSLSNTIAKIERQLGLSLFDRTTRSLVLTQEGERLAAMADDLVKNFQATLRSIYDAASGRRGRVSLALLPSVASSIAPNALCHFLLKYPDFDIGLHDTWQDKGVTWVFDRVVDFGVFARPANAAELDFELIYRDEFQAICRRQDSLASHPTASWRDLAQHPVILTGSSVIRRDVEASWSRARVTIKPRFEIEQIMTGLALVSAGLGIAILPALYLPQVLDENLAAVRIDNLNVARDIGILRRTDRGLTQPAQELIACFRQSFAEFEAKHGTGSRSRSSRKAGASLGKHK